MRHPGMIAILLLVLAVGLHLAMTWWEVLDSSIPADAEEIQFLKLSRIFGEVLWSMSLSDQYTLALYSRGSSGTIVGIVMPMILATAGVVFLFIRPRPRARPTRKERPYRGI